MKYKQCPELTTQSVDDEVLILDLNKDNIHQLNPTARFIWSKCDGSHSENDLAKMLVEQYKIDIDTAANDVSRVLKELQTLALIEPAS